MTRNTEIERHWLDTIAFKAGMTEADVDRFRAEANRRLRKGEEEYGDSFATRTLSELLGEVREEAVDIPSWLVLTLQKLEQDPEGRPEQVRVHAGRIFAEIGRKAAEMVQLCQAVEELWEDNAPEPEPALAAPPPTHPWGELAGEVE